MLQNHSTDAAPTRGQKTLESLFSKTVAGQAGKSGLTRSTAILHSLLLLVGPENCALASRQTAGPLNPDFPQQADNQIGDFMPSLSYK